MQTYDRSMNTRLVEEINRFNITDAELQRRIGAKPKVVDKWRNHNAIPSPYNLAKLYHLGADIIYILVGERTR